MPLGNEPIIDTVVLTAGADWAHRINVASGETLPTGTTAVIRFYADKETASTPIAQFNANNVNEVYAEWRVESTSLDAIENNSFFRIYVTYPETPTFENCWYRGKVQRQQ